MKLLLQVYRVMQFLFQSTACTTSRLELTMKTSEFHGKLVGILNMFFVTSIASNHDRFTINAHQARRTLNAAMFCMHCRTHSEQRYPNPKRTRRADNKVWERYIAQSASG